MTSRRIHSAVVLAFLSFGVGVPSAGPSFSHHIKLLPGGIYVPDDEETRDVAFAEDEEGETDRDEGEP